MSEELERLLAKLDFAAQDWDSEEVAELSDALLTHLREAKPPASVRFGRDLREALRDSARAGDLERTTALTKRLHGYLQEALPRDPGEFVSALQHAAERYDRPRVNALCEGLIALLWQRSDPYPLGISCKVLEVLRRKRHFDLMVAVAETLIQSGRDEPRIHRLYAQAMLDRGQSVGALAILKSLVRRCEKIRDDTESGSEEHQHAQSERLEATGLIGRSYKQIYMDAARRGGASFREDALRKAIDAYLIPYEENKEENLWHGINVVALLCRAQRDGVVIDPLPIDPKAAAEGKIVSVTAKESPNLWDYGTAAEACLALGDYEEALIWINKYTSAEGADAFEYASTLRQFEEVWQLSDEVQEEANILIALRAELLRHEGGSIVLTDPVRELHSAARYLGESDEMGENGQRNGDVPPGSKGQFEKTFGTDRYKSMKWYLQGVSQARAVAKVEDRAGNGVGTGFLLAGATVHPSIADEWVMVTNAHVISTDPAERAGNPPSLPPDEVHVRFCGSDEPDREVEVGEIVYSSGRHELDCTIVKLRGPVSVEHQFHIPKSLPRLGNQRIYVIGHPKGGQLSFSLHDNDLLDHEAPRIHYRSPTEGGSSGSPIFNSAWGLIGLHHFGGTEMKRLNGKAGTYPANEGMWIHSVLAAVAAKLG